MIWYLTRFATAGYGAVFLISFLLAFHSYGLNQGLHIGRIETDEMLEAYNVQKIQISSHGLPTYEDLNQRYTLICIFISAALGSSLFASLIKRKGLRAVVALLMGIVGSLLASNILRVLIREKSLMDEGFWTAPRNSFARTTWDYDWFLVMLITLASVVQILAVSMILRNLLRKHT